MLVTVAIDDTAAVLTPPGDIDADALPGLLAAARELPASVTTVTWDLRHVGFMDAAGLRLLTGQRQDCRTAGRTLTVTGLGWQPLRLLDLAAQCVPDGLWEDFRRPAAPTNAA
ncbi:STAS domain-containing protein [Streptomyces sp. NPDC003719]